MELNEFVNLFANQFDDSEYVDFRPETEYQNLEEWSSIVILSVIAMVRTNYGKKVTASDLRSCKTIEELYDLIKQR